MEILFRVVRADGRVHHLGDVRPRHEVAVEPTVDQAIHDRQPVLPVAVDGRLVLPGARVREAHQLRLVHGGPEVARSARGDGEAQAHALHDAWFVSGRFHALAVHGDALELRDLLLDSQDALRPDIADALTESHLAQELGDAVRIAELHLLVDEAPVGRLDGEGAEVAGGDRVDAETVADVVQPHDLGEVDDLTQAAEHVGRLVLGAFALEALVATLEDEVVLDALHDARRAHLGPRAVLLEHRLDTDLLEAVDGALAPVPGREGVGAVHRAHHVERAPTLVGGHARVVLAALDHVTDQGLEIVRSRDLDLLVAVPDDALQVLAAEDRSRTAAAQLVPVVVVHAGEPHELLAGGADDARLRPLVRRALEDLVFGLEGVKPPEVRRAVELDAGLADLEVHGRVRLSLDDHDLEPGLGELRCDVAAGVALAVPVGQRRDVVEAVAVAAEHGRASHRPGHEDELRLGAQRVHLRPDLVAQVVRADPFWADQFLDQLGGYRLLCRRARGEIDAQEVAHTPLLSCRGGAPDPRLVVKGAPSSRRAPKTRGPRSAAPTAARFKHMTARVASGRPGPESPFRRPLCPDACRPGCASRPRTQRRACRPASRRQQDSTARQQDSTARISSRPGARDGCGTAADRVWYRRRRRSNRSRDPCLLSRRRHRENAPGQSPTSAASSPAVKPSMVALASPKRRTALGSS